MGLREDVRDLTAENDPMHAPRTSNTLAPGQIALESPRSSAADAANMPSFRFQGYTLRPALSCDYGLARLWTQMDPDHQHKTLPEFWLTQGVTVNSFVLEDSFGPLFFFRMDVEAGQVAVHIQFPPDDRATRRRLMQGMAIGFTWLEKRLGLLGFQTVYFNSNNPRLIAFCSKRFGFEWDGRKLVRTVQ